MSRGSRLVRLLARGAGRWIAGFPYLVVGVVVVQVLSPWSRFGAFVLAMTLVGWRDVAEVTAERVEAVMRREFAEAARALGTPALRFARLHLLPELAPALSLELLFQASAVIVLLGELGYLNVYLSAHTLALLEQTGGGRGPSLAAFQVAQQPELGQLLSGARNYILQEQWAPVLIPGALLAAFALAFELLGSGLRARLSVRR
jgi:peptide/nickel transport system permease protein